MKMKKFIYILCFSLLGLTACKKEEDTTFEVAVQLKGMPDGVRAFINLTDEKGKPRAIDTIVVQNEQAIFKGNITVPEMAYLKVNGTQSNFPFILENGKITIDFFKDSVTSSIISNGKYNQQYKEFLKESSLLRDKMLSIRKELGEKTRDKDTTNIPILKEKLTDIQTEVKNYQISYIENHPDGFITPILLERSLHSKSLSEKQVLVYYNALSEKMRQTTAAKNIAKSIVIGTKATFFSAPDPEGNIIALNDVKGKVTIIDFWASWCGPCRKENPNVVDVYKKYHDKGLNIIGVSLDGSPRQKDAKQAWLNAIEKDGLTWTHVSNLKHWKEPIAKMYNVRSIPATFILDENGIIVAKNVRGAALEPKIKELLGL